MIVHIKFPSLFNICLIEVRRIVLNWFRETPTDLKKSIARINYKKHLEISFHCGDKFPHRSQWKFWKSSRSYTQICRDWDDWTCLVGYTFDVLNFLEVLNIKRQFWVLFEDQKSKISATTHEQPWKKFINNK